MSEMRTIHGIAASTNSLQLERIGDLLYFNWPLITVYRDHEETIYLRSLLEETNDKVRYAFFKVDKFLLKAYIEGNVPYLDVLTHPLDDLYLINDVDSSGDSVLTVIASNALNNDYIPKVKSFIDEEDSDEIALIVTKLNLDKLNDTFDTSPFNILEEASAAKSDLINIHLSSRNGTVGYGKVQSHILGETLTHYHKIAEATVVNLFNKSSYQSEDHLTVKQAKSLAITEFAYSKAASFSMFLKPVNVIRDDKGETSTEKVQSTMFSLFELGDDASDIKKHDEFSPEMLNAYSSFLKVIRDNDVKLTLQYGNVDNQHSYINTFDKGKSERVLQALSLKSMADEKNTYHEGSFVGISSRKKTFEFVEDNGSIYEGNFSVKLSDEIYSYRFNRRYGVTLRTKTFDNPNQRLIKTCIIDSVKKLDEVLGISSSDDTED